MWAALFVFFTLILLSFLIDGDFVPPIYPPMRFDRSGIGHIRFFKRGALTKSAASSAATVAVAAVVAPAAIPLAVVAGVGTAAVYGIKKLISIFD